MKGERLADGFQPSPPKGAYWKDENGVWSVRTPNGRIGTVENHEVVEHDDRTISVSPSIQVFASEDGRRPAWHGYLERGVWREC